jgi:putative flippase GtrA
MKDKITVAYKNHRTDIVLFVISGLLAFIVDFSTLQLVDKATGSLLAASVSGVAAGFVVSYVLNQMRFKYRHVNARKPSESFALFVVLFIFNSGFTFLCLEFNENNLNLPRILVKVATVSCIMMWNYTLFHYIVFRKKPNK